MMIKHQHSVGLDTNNDPTRTDSRHKAGTRESSPYPRKPCLIDFSGSGWAVKFNSDVACSALRAKMNRV